MTFYKSLLCNFFTIETEILYHLGFPYRVFKRETVAIHYRAWTMVPIKCRNPPVEALSVTTHTNRTFIIVHCLSYNQNMICYGYLHIHITNLLNLSICAFTQSVIYVELRTTLLFILYIPDYSIPFRFSARCLNKLMRPCSPLSLLSAASHSHEYCKGYEAGYNDEGRFYL